MDTELRYRCSFKLYRTNVAQRLMQSLPIVEHLDELKHRHLRLLAGVEILFMHELILQRAEEAFHHGIVKTVTFAAHAGKDIMLSQHALVGDARVQRALIGVMNQPRCGRRCAMAICSACKATC